MDRIWLVMDCRWKTRWKNESGMIHCFLVGSRYHSLRLAAEKESQVWGIAVARGSYIPMRTCARTHTHRLIESPY